MGIFIGWLVLSLLVGIAGQSRKIGGTGAFFLSLLLSPLIGLIGVALSNPKPPTVVMRQQPAQPDKFETLERLTKLKNDGGLTEAEFQLEKAKLMDGE